MRSSVRPLEKSGGYKMKKLHIAVLALLAATLGIPVPAHGKPRQAAQDEAKPEVTDIKGTVKSNDGKITFVTDEGGKSWDVMNPEVLRNHVDHHVQLSVQTYPDKGQIRVVTVTMI
jgi:hypothetical protein